MTASTHLIVAADVGDFPRLASLEAAGDAQFPPRRLPGEPGSDNVPVEQLEAVAQANDGAAVRATSAAEWPSAIRILVEASLSSSYPWHKPAVAATVQNLGISIAAVAIDTGPGWSHSPDERGAIAPRVWRSPRRGF